MPTRSGSATCFRSPPTKKKSRSPAPSPATRPASDCGRANRRYLAPPPSSIPRSPGVTTRATAWFCATTSRCRGRKYSCTTMPCSRATSTSRRRAIASAITSRMCAIGRRCVSYSVSAARSRRRPAPIRSLPSRRRSARWRRSRARSADWCMGRSNAYEAWPEGYVCFNRRFMYAGLDWCTQNYSKFVDELRELCGGGVFQMPADVSVMDDPELATQFLTYWQTPQADALTRMKLFKLAWDMVGSEFAGRHLQYEKFYAGAAFIIRNHSYRETDWAEFNKLVEDLMASYDYRRPDAARPAVAAVGG